MPYKIDKVALAPISGGVIRGRLTLQPGSETTGNLYGADVLVRVFWGFTNEIYKLLPIRGVSHDKWLRNFLCTDYKVTEGRGGTSIARVTYIGLVGRIPLPKIVGGWSEESAQVSTTILEGAYYDGAVIVKGPGVKSPTGYLMLQANTQNPGNGLGAPAGYYIPQLEDQGEASVIYCAPETTYTYITASQPTAPMFGGQLLAGMNNFQILEVRPATLLGRIVYGLVTRTAKFDWERQGDYFGVQEVTRGIVTSAMVLTGATGGVTGSQTLGDVWGPTFQEFSGKQQDKKGFR